MLRVGKAEGVPFFATELIAGVPLAQHSAAGNLLDRQTVASIAVRVADALQQAHERGLVHGDVRPGNIFFQVETGQVKVTDFGVAQIATSIPTAGGVIHGTPSYMSPEQISGRKVDARSDLYSLCVTIYQLLCGQLPFGGDTFNDLIYAIVSGSAPDICQVDPSLPGDLTSFFQRGFAKNPNQRFQTGHELAEELRKALAWAA
jgi:eukaryotic-like serine/threonine-protein kinase